MEWAAFEKTFGPLTIQERLDHVGAILARSLGVKRDQVVKAFTWDQGDPADAFASLFEEAERAQREREGAEA